MAKRVNTLLEDIAEIKEILGRQEEILKEHMRRTEALEEMVKPIQRRVFMLEGIFYFLGSLGVASSVAWTVMKLWHT